MYARMSIVPKHTRTIAHAGFDFLSRKFNVKRICCVQRYLFIECIAVKIRFCK